MTDDPQADTAKSDKSVQPSAERPLAASVHAADRHLWVFPALAVALPLAFFFVLPPLTKSGLWDPYELNVADLGRRIALNLLGAGSLALTGADNSLPHLNDLGRPQLALTSIAVGFKLFGLHEWAGRLPLAVWGLLGVLSTYGFVSRLVDRRAGLYAAVALTTMPLFFVQARTMLGDVVPMSALAMAFGGLAVTMLDRTESGPTSVGARLPWLALGVLGLLAGFASRGGALGLGVPLIAVGGSWALVRASGEKLPDGLAEAVGVGSLVVGLGSVALAYVALLPEVESGSKLLPLVSLGQERASDLNYWVGAMAKTPSKYPTFDYYIGHLGPALVPWSAFAPFAVGRLFMPPAGVQGAAERRESLLRMFLLVGLSVAFALHAFLSIKTELIAFTAPAIVAAACAVAIRDYERGAHPSLAVGVGTVVFLGLFHHDFHELPEKAYQAFAVTGATFPESFKDHALELWTLALIGFAGIAFLTWVERDPDREPFDPRRYARVLRSLREAYDGLLALSFFALVAGASVAGLVIWLGTVTHARWLPAISLQIRDGVLNAWWATAFVPLAVIFGLYFACDVWLWAFGRSRRFAAGSLTRGFEPFEALYAKAVPKTSDLTGEERWVGRLIVAPLMLFAVPAMVGGPLMLLGVKPLLAASLAIPSGVVAFLYMGAVGDLLKGSRPAFFALNAAVVGFVLCFSYYPALANQVSPKEVFESFEKLRSGSEPLGLFGVGGRTAAYYAGGQPETLTDTAKAYSWLTGGGGSRRFLAMKSEELPKMNQLFRDRVQPRQNLPVLDARSSQILLVASSLQGEKNENPLGKILLSEVPRIQHKLDVNMEDKLQVLGYDLTDASGNLVDAIGPGRKYRMRTYYRVLAPVTTEWEAFIHIDGFGRRHNGDHKPMDGKYPFSLWLKDDMLVDDYEISLEPNYSPGPYELYFGLFVGETRLKVKSGPSDGENRINGGTLKVQ